MWANHEVAYVLILKSKSARDDNEKISGNAMSSYLNKIEGQKVMNSYKTEKISSPLFPTSFSSDL